MQSFRERSGFHGNQHCYQQEPHELSRLETYRHHHGQSRQGYETHSLSAAGMPTAGAGSKDCYGQQTYPSYSSSTAQAKKPYRGGKAAGQHLPAGYSSHMTSGYSAQYMSEGHLQQKWDESAQMSQYEQDMVGRLEPGVSGSSQYLEQNMLAISQSQCHLPTQPSTPVYTSPHQQGHAPNPTPSPLMYPQSQLHFPQHSQPPSSTSSSYMDKCNPMPHGYKSGYGMPPNAQYSRQLGNHSSMKQSGYRPQNSYGYQQPSSRTGFDQQASLQAMPGTQESLQKFQHYNQPQQNYCITDISVRSPEQYYQNCSPSSSHSPARSVGRSPSYSSTPSPLMPNPDTFQYGQQINPTPSSSSAGLQEQSMLMPPHTHPSPSVSHQPQSYSSSMKDRFSEKLLSNPSLWSLNALTSQVENISNNVQQLLLSEALMANKKGSKRNQPKKGEDYRGQARAMEDSSCPDSQQVPPPTDAYGTPRSMPAELQEGGYSSNTEDQMERSYYYFGQGKATTQASTHSQLSLDTVSTCSINSTDDMSVRSGDSVRSLQSAVSEDNLSCDPRVQRVPFGEEQNSSLRSIRDERSPISVTAPSPMKQESNSPLDIKRSESNLKENFEESAWTDRMADEKEIGKKMMTMEHECKGEVIEGSEKQREWLEDEKCPSLFHKINKVVSDESFSYKTVDTVYQDLKNKYEAEERGIAEKGCGLSDTIHRRNEDSDVKPEMFKSESQPNSEGPATMSPAISRDILQSNQYLPEKEESSDMHRLSTQAEPSEERQSFTERPNNSEDHQSVSSHPAPEVREEKGCLTPSEEVANNKAKPEEDAAEACNKPRETAGGLPVTAETAETTAQDTTQRISERRSAICDIAPQSHSVKTGFSTLNEKTTPLTQARDHIDRSDAKVLEPDSPQLPGKSIMHSAPSWADTPPSPQKGDEDIEPGISCPSAVTPSAKPEPFVPSAHPRLLGRKHARGRRRLIHSNAGIRRQPSIEGDGTPPSPQKPSMPSSNSALFTDQMDAAQLDISSQTPKLLGDGLPSRMCTRSFGSQSSPKACSQERRKPGPKPGSKPGPKPGSKPGPKPGPKPGLKPGPKPGLKSVPKPSLKLGPGLKPGPKPSTKPGPKPGPKPGSKPGPKPGPKPGAVPTVKPGSKPGPKPAAIPALKSGPKPGSKPTEGLIPKGPGRPRGLTSKSMKHEDNVQPITEYIKNTRCISATSEEQENTTLTLGAVGTTLGTSIESIIGSTVEIGLDTTSIKPVAKDQKSMVLRSRKQTPGKLIQDKEKENETLAEAQATKLTDTQIKEAAAAQPCENQTSNLKAPTHEDVCMDSLSQPNEEIVSVSIKRKSSLQSPNPVKKKKGVKISQTKTHEPPLKTVKGGHGSKGKRKRGNKLEPSLCSLLTKENPPTEDINDTPCVPPQCPTKTKYLPPRKGRGLKYEAMVQKITSPASKKQPQTVQPDVVPEESKPAQESEVTEKTETTNAQGVAPEDGETTVSFEETLDTACIQTPRKKRKKWSTVEITEAPEVVPEAESLIINTPRLAKQRAIKNNHEMHLKQQKKRRKCAELANDASAMEEQDQAQIDLAIPPPPLSPSPAPQLPSTFFSETGEKMQSEHPPAQTTSITVKPKRGRRPTLKKKQEEALGQCTGKEEIQKVKKKPGPKKKVQQSNVIKVTIQAPKLKAKPRKEKVPTVKAKLSDFLKPQGSESKCSFRPYVRIDSSREIASLCTIVNRPEEEQLLIQSRKKCLTKIKNLVTVTKALPNCSVMLQGPLVNRGLTDRCLACCLCGKPANYRELGDLCGPYYPEDSVPRKTLSLMHREDFRQNRDRDKDMAASCSAEPSDTLKNDEAKDDLLQEGTSEEDCGQLRRERRAQIRSRLGLRMRFKRLQLLRGSVGGIAPPAGEGGYESALMRLKQEAESTEHWAHEACAIWTNGVILVSGKLYGLREAAQDSTVTKCSKCQSEGASIGCSGRNCTHKYHYVCAKETGCIFEEDTFSIKCPKHKDHLPTPLTMGANGGVEHSHSSAPSPRATDESNYVTQPETLRLTNAVLHGRHHRQLCSLTPDRGLGLKHG